MRSSGSSGSEAATTTASGRGGEATSRPDGRNAIATAVVVALIAILVPPLFVVNAFRVLAQDSFVRYELARDGFPPDRYGLAAPERLELALTGLASIRPGGEGIALLERARLPDGAPAFNERELRHMSDVRRLLGAAFQAQVAVLVLLGALSLVLVRSSRHGTLVARGLLIGSLATIGVAVLALPVILLGFDEFFTRFHGIFFAGDTWRFANSDTLLRLYPELFWRQTAQFAAGLALAQAIVVAAVAAWWLRRARADRRA